MQTKLVEVPNIWSCEDCKMRGNTKHEWRGTILLKKPLQPKTGTIFKRSRASNRWDPEHAPGTWRQHLSAQNLQSPRQSGAITRMSALSASTNSVNISSLLLPLQLPGVSAAHSQRTKQGIGARVQHALSKLASEAGSCGKEGNANECTFTVLNIESHRHVWSH